MSTQRVMDQQQHSFKPSSGEPVKSHSEMESREYVKVIVTQDTNGRKRKLFVPASLDLDRPKRPRTTFSEEQLRILEIEFNQNHFITETRRHSLSLVLGLSETQIKVWFQNRRTKFRRSNFKADENSKPNSSTNQYYPWIFTFNQMKYFAKQ